MMIPASDPTKWRNSRDGLPKPQQIATQHEVLKRFRPINSPSHCYSQPWPSLAPQSPTKPTAPSPHR